MKETSGNDKIITKMVGMETVWKKYGEWYLLWRFCGKISLEIVLGFMGKTW